MAIDWTILIGSLIQIVVILLGGVSVLVTLRNTVAGLKTDVAESRISRKNFKRWAIS
jgi:hypothetical protein